MRFPIRNLKSKNHLYPDTSLRWKLGLVAATCMALLACYPQLNLWAARGQDWQGSFAHIDSDEVAYAAYLQALIDGRPRRNDPYTGHDDAPTRPQTESLFSIQFIPPYAIALLARGLRLSASTVFILLLPLIAFVSSLSIFRLMVLLTEDERVAAASVFVVLCLGTFGPVYVGWQALRGMDMTFAYSFLPFLRRFQPATAFPLFFLFCASLWRALQSTEAKQFLISTLTACLSFGLLVFSYFYLWTAALAWLACLVFVLLIVRPSGWRRDVQRACLILAVCSLALIPYFILVAGRAPSMDSTQLLALSRRPDLFHWSEIVGFLVIIAIVALCRGRRYLSAGKEQAVAVFAAAFALVPLVVFNQQILTGRSLQPLHYDLFIAKHTALLALILTATLIWKARGVHTKTHGISARLLVVIAAASFGWGWIEAVVATRRYAQTNVRIDESRRVSLRLEEMARTDGPGKPLVISSDLMLADTLPTDARLPVLWAPHQQVFSGVTGVEHKERLYQQLYYTGVRFSQTDAGQALRNPDPQKRYFIGALHGWGRSDPAWNVAWQPLTPTEAEAEIRGYQEFSDTFDQARAAQPTLTFLVVSARRPLDLSNLEKWYERDEGERVGDFIIYRLKLRR